VIVADAFQLRTFVDAVRFIGDHGSFLLAKVGEHVELSAAAIGIALAIALVLLVVALFVNTGLIITIPLVLGAAGRPWTLTPAEVKLSFDALTTAKRALRAKAPGDVGLKLSHSRLAVRAWVASIASKVYRAPRDARAKITLRHIYRTRAKHGKALDQKAVAAQIDAALDDGVNAPRTLHTKLRKTSPKVNANDLARLYGTVITVDKSHFKLRLFKNLKFFKSYSVAVGQPAYPTPSGLFSIQDKQVDPVWSVPNSPWAGELQGTTVQGGTAANPLKARWMGIVNGVGIHGTAEDASIGSRASHGCIRMHVPDVIDLYPRVPVGTPVLIG
jgi:lipoprotein-anchoring transpeptidase ErfK/SrfK